MSTSTDAYLVYGIPLKDDSFYIDTEIEDRESPSYIASMGKSVNDISILVHCSDKCPQYIVHLTEAKYTANRGYIQDIDPSKLVIPEGGDDKLRDFCRVHELETEGDPGWLLCSYWG